mmetsp:Transcript_47090/g.114944  ORF Transcript_47090/g.114944 Transcript_47090/m.114944 type:complete len:754 (+) Transcript_47090:198-2459(+)
MNDHDQCTQDELDTFLSSIESKLRSPFSSLDLARAANNAAALTTTASSSNVSGDSAVSEYLRKLLQVITKPDKIIQCRMLIGLLGIDVGGSNNSNSSSTLSSSNSSNKERLRSNEDVAKLILQILDKTQSEKDGGDGDEGSGGGGELTASNKEWVRIISGLVQGIMFTTAKKTRNTGGNDDIRSRDHYYDNNSRESCRGKEASVVVLKLGSNVCQVIQKEIHTELQHHIHHHQKQKQTTKHMPPDLNACFAPYRYSLVTSMVLNTIIPELDMETSYSSAVDTGKKKSMVFPNNCHFQVNASAEILREDEELEHQRAKEQLEHQSASAGGTSTSATGTVNSNYGGGGSLSPKSAAAAAATTAPAIPANFRPANLTSSRKKAAAAGASTAEKSSMFMPSSKNGRVSQSATSKSNLFNTTSSANRRLATGAAAGKLTPGRSIGGGAAGIQKTLLRRKLGVQQHVKRATAAGTATINSVKREDNNSTITPPTGGQATAGGGVGAVGRGVVGTASSRLGGLAGTKQTFGGGRYGGGLAAAKKSKMKMIDISEVGDLNKRDTEASNNSSSRASKKRRIMEQAQRQGIKKTKTPSQPNTTVTTTTTPSASASSTTSSTTPTVESPGGTNFAAPQESITSTATNTLSGVMNNSTMDASAVSDVGGAATATSVVVDVDVVSGLASIVQDRNNKMSDNDQVRLQQFMQGLPNTTPDQGPSYKMKIHEVRRKDDATGGDIKETFYIELDYNTYRYNQSKKVKRY